ncbi:hypothetical protein [Kribbella caucasensis]|nr:hypothetical protein [Kribbella sp. VKM Ac-2527]
MESMGPEPQQPQGCLGRGRCAVADFTTATNRRTSFGYINEHFMMGDSELAAMRRRIVECCQADGGELAAIYIERVETSPFAWRALLEKLADSSGLNVVIVPGLHHLASIGHPIEVRNILLEFGANVLVAAQGDRVGRAAHK